MKFPGSDAFGGLLASFLLHLLAGAAVLSGVPFGTAPRPPVIDLTLLPSLESGRTAVRSLAAPGGVRGPAEPPRPAAVPPPSPAPSAPPAAPSQAPAEAAAPGPAKAPSSASAFPRAAPAGGAEWTLLPSEEPEGVPSGSLPPGRAGASATPEPSAGAGDAGRNFGYLRDTIQRGIAYPDVARRMGWEGRVLVAFLILPDGTVRNVRVVRGSGFPVLDRNAVEAVRAASPFPRPPAEAEIVTPVVYKLY